GISRARALEQMQERNGWYDSRVLDATFAGLDVYLPMTSAAKATRLAINGDQLRVQHILNTDLLTADGALIFPAGTEISELILEKIRNFQELSGLKEPIHVEA